MYFNPLNSELNPIRHLLALVEAHHFVDVSRIRVNINYNVHMLLGRLLHVSAPWCHLQGSSTFLAKITHSYNLTNFYSTITFCKL
jgi:hypothetical protein